MQDHENPIPAPPRRTPWNKGKLIGAKPPLRTKARLVDPDQAPDRGANT